VNIALARREVALAAVALLAIVTALAAGLGGSENKKPLPRAVPVPGEGGWYRSFAAPYPASASRDRTVCGFRLGAKTLGVAHPVLPCRVKLFISYGDKTVLTQVIDRGPGVPGREFDITRALAAKLGLRGTQQIRWRYAR
jgi:rare lipoprotein A (RlpA)-like double-psi beta-barrel protein